MSDVPRCGAVGCTDPGIGEFIAHQNVVQISEFVTQKSLDSEAETV